MSMMSLSPTTSTSNYDDTPSNKRRRTTSFNAPANGGPRSEMDSPPDLPSGHGGSSSAAAHIPKRGARACTNCRKGKNRCEGEVRTLHLSPPCRRLLTRTSPRLPAHPPGPAICWRWIHPLYRLPVVDVSLAGHNVSSRNQRRRVCRPCPLPASSKSPHNPFFSSSPSVPTQCLILRSCLHLPPHADVSPASRASISYVLLLCVSTVHVVDVALSRTGHAEPNDRHAVLTGSHPLRHPKPEPRYGSRPTAAVSAARLLAR